MPSPINANDANAVLAEGRPLRLHPSQSASRFTRCLILGASWTVLSTVGVGFAALGAWPVAVVAFAVGGGLSAAFCACAHQNTKRRQVLTLDDGKLHIDNFYPYNRRPERVSMHCYWTRLSMMAEDRAGQPPNNDGLMEVTERLIITDGQKNVVIGDFLPPDERPIVKRIIERGVGQYKPGGTTVHAP